MRKNQKMNRHNIRLRILACLTAYIIIFISGVAAANTEENVRVFKMGADVTVPANEILTEAVAFGGNVTILDRGQVRNDAVAIGGDVILNSNARVGGDAVAIGGEIIKEANAIVDGSQVMMFSNAKVLFDRFGLFGTAYLINSLFYLAFSLVIFIFGVFFLLLLPEHLTRINATMERHPLKSGVWGLGGIVSILLFTTLFAGSVFGFLLIPIANVAFIVAGLLGAISTGLWVGKKILSHGKQNLFSFTLGIFVLAIIALIPIAGGLIVLILNLFGFGAVLFSRIGTVSTEKISNHQDKGFDLLEGTMPLSR